MAFMLQLKKHIQEMKSSNVSSKTEKKRALDFSLKVFLAFCLARFLID